MGNSVTKHEEMTAEETVATVAAAATAVAVAVTEVVKARKQGVTAKTLGALKEQAVKIKEAELLGEEEYRELEKLLEKVRKNWIEKNL